MKKLTIIKKIMCQQFVAVLLLMLVLTSCDSYLDVEPKGVQVLKTVNDYNLWLNNKDIITSIPDQLNMLADNVDNINIRNPQLYASELIYTWREQFSDDPATTPVIWSPFYKTIYYFNTVLEEIDEASGDTEGDTEVLKESLKAEALLGRAFQYLYLVNLYGKSYNITTADQDLAVPFVVSNDLYDSTPNRGTVQEIYNHIIADITSAIPDLPQDNSENTHRGSVAAGYGVLARAYLYMGDYLKAAENAQLSLDNGPDTILDYTTMSSGNDIPALIRRPDAIYAELNPSYYYPETPTLSFLQSFDTTDLRLQFFYANTGDYSFTTRGQTKYQPQGYYANWGISVAEMRLIIAEASARMDDLPTAINQLDLLRSKRFMEVDYVKYDPISPIQEEVLQKILDERTFEFPYCGLRWFDMRRLDAEDRMPLVNRYDGQEDLIATLPAGSNKYTLQIPIQVLYFNPDWTQNP